MDKKVRDILKEYEALQSRADKERKERVGEIHRRIPRIRDIDDTISRLGLECASYSIGLKPSEQKEYLEAFAGKVEKLKGEKLALLKEHGYPPDYTEIKHKCSNCNDTGYVGQKKCSCFRQKLIDRAYSQSNLSGILSRENFSTFDINLFSAKKLQGYSKTPRQNMLDILSRCESFVHNFENNEEKNLLFYGGTGLGKTFMCNCIAKKLLDKGKPVLYLTAFKLFKILEEYRFRPKDTAPDQDTLDFILTCDLLIIDDLGTELTNSFTKSELFNIINTRLLERKKTIISTNFQPDELLETYGQRVFSRLSEPYRALEFYGHDLRM
ncbi:MAG: ATP-binding protein [Bacillota bacterium]|nr:ATP-binding protein [Bacillota bacterium]MDD3297998.1 ATP-binding protein [Bacillota bacterium]MDD3850029.1 ATP-binding protein [Bacillota bacterium]MDD4706734.1 ATP-binding protein [Bacillota bacterium]